MLTENALLPKANAQQLGEEVSFVPLGVQCEWRFKLFIVGKSRGGVQSPQALVYKRSDACSAMMPGWDFNPRGAGILASHMTEE